MELFKNNPLVVREYEPVKSHTVPMVELGLVTQIAQQVVHDKGALNHLCDSVPAHADGSNENLAVALCGSSQPRELGADCWTVPDLF